MYTWPPSRNGTPRDPPTLKVAVVAGGGVLLIDVQSEQARLWPSKKFDDTLNFNEALDEENSVWRI
ncbi:hypothetical protein GJ744_007926 [Endocarpon pusillum]|uniref:Uncharacterized protein n=1 Tax=Endocarpon pusillum TaxID=364733 RepID=A0A8H7AM71_9EURO|nr:hypothetical protein GJ744_007926 [Endocarpon pusillum]